MRIADYANNCVLVALHHVSRLPEEDVVRVCLEYGFDPKRGMYEYQWRQAMATLSIGYEEVSVHPVAGDSRLFPTLHQFAKSTKRQGVWLVRTRSHLLVVNRGVVVDPNIRATRGSRRRVYSAYRIKNPRCAPPRPSRLPADPMFEFVRLPAALRRARRKRSDDWSDLEELYARVCPGLNRRLRLSEVEHFGYTRKRLRADLRRGDARLTI